MLIYFTSDLHFNHINIIKYCNRPFQDVNEMNAVLINNYNSIVRPEDTCYILGDFAMGLREKISQFAYRLNGHKILILGNHDYQKKLSVNHHPGFEKAYDELIIELEGKKIYLRHEPRINFKEPTQCDIHLHGHVHTEWGQNGELYNVGVDVRNYTPVTLQQILAAGDLTSDPS